MRPELRDWSATSRWSGGPGSDGLTGQAVRSTILIGLAGNDTLNGGSQRDLLFGGLGADIIMGVGGDDVLISGTKSVDEDSATLLQLHYE